MAYKGDQKVQPFGENVVLLLITIMDAWLFTTAKYLSGFAEGPFPVGIRVSGAGEQEKKKSRRGQ